MLDINNIENLISFEQHITSREGDLDWVYNPAWIQKNIHISADDANQILACCFRKGLLEKIDEDNYHIKTIIKPEIISVFQFAEKTGLKPKSLVRSVEQSKANQMTAEILKIPIGAWIYLQKRSRLINNLVIANQCNSIPLCVTPGLENLNLGNNSFQVILEEKYHAVVYSIEERFALVSSSKEDQQILSLQADSKVISINRLSLSSTGMPLVWADIHLNPQHFHLVEKLWPLAKNLLPPQENESRA